MEWYTHKPEFVLENETHQIIWDFEIEMDHLIPARMQEEKNMSSNGFCCPDEPQPKDF